jgi:osmotically-inducible protein OsmY
MNRFNLKRSLHAAAFSAALLSLGASLTACVPLVLGGAAGGAALIASDRRSSGMQLEDESIELRIVTRVRNDFGTRVRVNPVSFNRQVLLTGDVASEQDRQAVEQLVRRVDNVASVVNELVVMNTPSLMDRSADLLITGRLKASILDDPELQSNAFKVVTERGTIYLMGRVTRREVERVTTLARGTSGARRVVRVFEEISDDQLRRLQPEANPPAAAPAKPRP